MFLFWGLLLLMGSVMSFMFSLFFLMNMMTFLLEYVFWSFGSIELKIFFFFDWMSLMFLSVVLFISGMVIYYSEDYMSGDIFKVYFLYGVLLFVGSMGLMIFSMNLLMILMGWDGLGLTSYCLVIYYQSSKSDSAGMMTVLSNRVGDVMILLSIVMMLNFYTLDLMSLKSVLWLMGVFLIVAGMTKSAQIPFSAWLPAAMAAPTPVSSLVHSSTLVTAGVYLLIRLNLMFECFFFSKFLLFISLMTVIMAGVGAMLEMDLKKIIALSTLSQIGLMMLVLSLGLSDLSFFHLLTHAIFKAMLFLCAGVMIHNNLGSQDIRLMGLYYKLNPVISGSFGLSSLALFGFPFLSGFYSKDLLLEYIYMSEKSFFMVFLIILATIFTCLYSFRLLYYVIWKGLFSNCTVILGMSFLMSFPIFIMGVVVVFFGSMMMWIIFPEPVFVILSLDVKLLNFFILIFSVCCFFSFFSTKKMLGKMKFMNFFSSLWFLSSLSSYFPMKVYNNSVMYGGMEMSWMEEVGPSGLYKMNMGFTKIIQWFQMNSVFSFFLFIFLFIFFC
nr:NADH dehydrogenase subunit 5 [Argas sp. San Antonio ARK-2022a]